MLDKIAYIRCTPAVKAGVSALHPESNMIAGSTLDTFSVLRWSYLSPLCFCPAPLRSLLSCYVSRLKPH